MNTGKLKKTSLLLIFSIFCFTLFSQSTTPFKANKMTLSELKDQVVDLYEISEGEFDDAWSTIPDLGSEELKELQKAFDDELNHPSIYENALLKFLDKYFPGELDYTIDNEDSELFLMLFAYKYQEHMYGTMKGDFENNHYASYDKKLNEFLQNEKIDVLRLGVLFDVISYEVEHTYAILWGETVDINAILKDGSESSTLLDFIYALESSNIPFEEENLENLESAKTDLLEDYNAKRFRTLQNGSVENELAELKEKEAKERASHSAEIRSAHSDYLKVLEKKYMLHTVPEGSDEEWYVYARMNYDLYTYVRDEKHAILPDNARKALSYANKALEISPNKYHYNYIKALALEINDKEAEAYALMKEFISKTDTASLIGHRLWENAFIDKQDYTQALKYIKYTTNASSNPSYLEDYQKTEYYHYYIAIPTSSLRAVRTELTIPGISWDKISTVWAFAFEDKILMSFYINKVENGELVEMEEKGIIFDFNGNVIKNYGNWRFADGTLIHNQPQSGVISIVEDHGIGKSISKFIDSNGKDVYIVENGGDHLENFKGGYAVFTDTQNKRVVIDENFNEVARLDLNCTYINEGDAIFTEHKKQSMCSGEGEFHLYYLNKDITPTWINPSHSYIVEGIIGKNIFLLNEKTGLVDIFNLDGAGKIKQGLNDNIQFFINGNGQQEAIVHDSQKHYRFNSREGLSVESNRKSFENFEGAQEGYLKQLTATKMYKNGTVYNMNDESSKQEVLFQYTDPTNKFNSKNYPIVSYYSGEESLLDDQLKKIELPIPDASYEHLSGPYYLSRKNNKEPKWNRDYYTFNIIKVE